MHHLVSSLLDYSLWHLTTDAIDRVEGFYYLLWSAAG